MCPESETVLNGTGIPLPFEDWRKEQKDEEIVEERGYEGKRTVVSAEGSHLWGFHPRRERVDKRLARFRTGRALGSETVALQLSARANRRGEGGGEAENREGWESQFLSLIELREEEMPGREEPRRQARQDERLTFDDTDDKPCSSSTPSSVPSFRRAHRSSRAWRTTRLRLPVRREEVGDVRT